MIDLPPQDPVPARVWETLFRLAVQEPRGWTLVGALMVLLHGYENGRTPSRPTVDADVLVDARAHPDATTRWARHLVREGFDLEGMSADGIGHRFTDGRVRIDILAPDGLTGGRARLTTIPPARTVRVPGGTQALRRSRFVDVRKGVRVGCLPRPDLLGAILVKARAVEVDEVPEAQLSDLAFLFSLVPDPMALCEELRGKERAWLRRRKELLDAGSAAWQALPEPEAENGILAFRAIAGL